MADPWDALGIGPTSDPAAIRRAYAEALKRLQPTEDPAGFMRLRAAYEAARGRAELVDHGPAAAPPAPPPPAPPRQEASPAASAITAALDRSDVLDAATRLKAGRTETELSLAEAMALSDRLLELLVSDLALPGAAVSEAAGVLGWYGCPNLPRSAPFDRLAARIEAERWLAVQQARSRSRLIYVGSQRSAAARLVVGRGRFVLSRLVPPEPPLRQMLAEYQFHARWIAHRLDCDRLDAVEAMAARRFTVWAGRMWLWVAFLPLVVMAAANTGGASLLVFGIAVELLRRYSRPVLLWMTIATVATIVVAAILH